MRRHWSRSAPKSLKLGPFAKPPFRLSQLSCGIFPKEHVAIVGRVPSLTLTVILLKSASIQLPFVSQARKRHTNINFWYGYSWDDPGNLPGTSRVCPWDKVGQTPVCSLFYTMEAQFVPGTNPVCPGTIPGMKGGRKVYVLKVYVPFSPICIAIRLQKYALPLVASSIP